MHSPNKANILKPMDKVYDQTTVEDKWYKFWEEKGFFKPEINPKGTPYTIILPPPNANGNLHFGHAMFTVEDILIRYHRMKGESALWLPGEDHAGTETQFVFEKYLKTLGKSRFDFDRPTLYKMIWDFVEENRGNIRIQMKRMGFSLDWTRLKYTLDPDIVKLIYKTFKKLFDDGLAYRAERLVNYCTKDGTSFSDLEVVYEERKDPLYFVRYPLVDRKTDEPEFLIVATTRPEPIMIDTHIAINPKDKKNSKFIGRRAKNPITGKDMQIIGDEFVDPEFGTGIVKLTPAHDPNDFEIAKKHNLPVIQVIGYDGKLNEKGGKFSGMRVKEAKIAVLEHLEQAGLIEKTDYEYVHRIGTCYKCKTVIEPLPLEQWYISTKPLAKKAIEVVKKGNIKIYPKNFEKIYFNWLENIRDWNISRQIVWGIQIPAWFCDSCKKWTVTEGEKLDTCPYCNDSSLEQDTDTFDTWFSLGQWPFVTLQTTNPGDFEKFYPTSVMETGRDILFFWVARMVMLGIYATGEIPFKDIVLHGTVLDPLGAKMSKSKGNVVNPIEIANQYGADAVRMALMYGTAFGHDQALSHPKLQAMRNFTNKLWNIGRFIIDFAPEGAKHLDSNSVIAKSSTTKQSVKEIASLIARNDNDEEILRKLSQTIKTVTSSLDNYRFHDAAESLYEFIWHEFADKYIESTKNEQSSSTNRGADAQPTLEYVFKTCLELLHPFMPFITEEIWQKLPHVGQSLMITTWPKV